ncbi:tRNA lysidine(34) synthetase TilS [Pediococcus stilesii]|uniref:tRNA(Ile)-lysidine synthase n=1 Tax=Pediococcus stilesii TaxID=331679 RepID=A0A5R9BXG8_9LACO|nr:tRNA lysidine(34) synthetase TilS [Pediococcus stilesii]TLQ04740.1 tRNA lysidine(34) synthetase TilS [Pediococcus stilesii]
MKINELGNQIVKKFDLKNKKMVVAVSTGVDSTVLINALIFSRMLDNSNLVVAHVNHKLRAASDQEEKFLRNWCTKHNIKLEVFTWEKTQHPMVGVEAAAREVRYEFFDRMMQKHQADVLLTAHNADEQAESFLMRLIRGGMLSELEGIPEQRPFATGTLIRPLLDISKAELIQLATTNQLTWFEDDTNQKSDFLRNRVRNEILPILREENDRALEHINQFQNQLTEQSRLLDQSVDAKLERTRNQEGYDLSQILAEPTEWQRLMLLKIVQKQLPSLPISQTKLTAMVRFINQVKKVQRFIDIGDDYLLEITYNCLRISKKKTIKTEQAMGHMVTLNTWFGLGDSAWFRVSDHGFLDSAGTMILSENQFKLPLLIRPVNFKDRLRLKNGGFKTIRRELIDQKIPNEQRQKYFAVVDANGTILWVPGLRKSWLQAPFVEKNRQFMMEFRTGGRPNGQ